MAASANPIRQVIKNHAWSQIPQLALYEKLIEGGTQRQPNEAFPGLARRWPEPGPQQHGQPVNQKLLSELPGKPLCMKKKSILSSGNMIWLK